MIKIAAAEGDDTKPNTGAEQEQRQSHSSLEKTGTDKNSFWASTAGEKQILKILQNNTCLNGGREVIKVFKTEIFFIFPIKIGAGV